MKQLLAKKKIRPTKIRVAVANMLLDGHDNHYTVDDVIDMVRQKNIKSSVASIYNTLNLFADAGLLRRVIVGQGKAFFDTNLSNHHHFYFEDEGRLADIPVDSIAVTDLPNLPTGHKISAVDVTIRLQTK